MAPVLLDCLRFKFPEFAEHVAAGQGDPIDELLPPAAEDEIRQIETRLGLSLPESYKHFLRCARGMWLRGGLLQLSGAHPFLHHFPKLEALSPSLRQAVLDRSAVWPPPSEGLVCFAEYRLEADGDQVLFDIRNGLVNREYPVVYYAHEEVPASIRKLTESFGEFLTACLRDYPDWVKRS